MKIGSGRTVILAALLAVALAFFLSGIWVEPEQRIRPTGRLPSILLVTVEGLRWDFSRHARLQYLEALERESIVFREAYSPSPLTLPAHASLMTGAYPPDHGLRGIVSFPLPQEQVTLAEVLRSRGYKTGAFLSSFFLDRRFALDQGFEHYSDSGDFNDRRRQCPTASAGSITRRAVEWLTQRPPEPFFLWVQYRLPSIGGRPSRGALSGRRVSDQVQYVKTLQFLDEEFGKLFRYLRQEGLWESLLVVVGSVHGMDLGDPGTWGSGLTLNDAALRVPLILKLPADQGPVSGDVNRPVSLVDLRPTLLDLIGIPDHQSSLGRSLVPAFNSSREQPDRPIYSESLYVREQFGGPWLRSVRMGPHRLVSGWRDELFSPPAEETDGDPEWAPAGGTDAEEKIRGDLEMAMEELSGAHPRRFYQELMRSPTEGDFARQLRECGYLEVPRHGEPESDPLALARLQDLEEAMVKARVLLNRGEWGSAERSLREILEDDPKNPSLLHLLGLVLRRRGQGADAAEILQEVLDRAPVRASIAEDLALVNWERGDLEGSVRALRTGIDNHPASIRLRNRLGSSLWELGDAEGARSAFEAALEIRPENPVALRSLSSIFREMGRMADATAKLRAALTHRPGWIEARLELAEILRETGSLLTASEKTLQARESFLDAMGQYQSILGRNPENQEAQSGIRQTRADLDNLLLDMGGRAPADQRVGKELP